MAEFLIAMSSTARWVKLNSAWLCVLTKPSETPTPFASLRLQPKCAVNRIIDATSLLELILRCLASMSCTIVTTAKLSFISFLFSSVVFLISVPCESCVCAQLWTDTVSAPRITCVETTSGDGLSREFHHAQISKRCYI